jgi:hypothetical protein
MNIIGKGSGWENAPTEGECWGITQVICRRPVTRVIDMNDYRLWGQIQADEAKKAREIAKNINVEYIDLENYPLNHVIQRFKTDYFNSTVDYAIALALYESYDDIHLWGINMINNEEYRHQKPGVEFWCGYAKGLGCNIEVHGKLSGIMKTKDGNLYGYDISQKNI